VQSAGKGPVSENGWARMADDAVSHIEFENEASKEQLNSQCSE